MDRQTMSKLVDGTHESHTFRVGYAHDWAKGKAAETACRSAVADDRRLDYAVWLQDDGSARVFFYAYGKVRTKTLKPDGSHGDSVYAYDRAYNKGQDDA
jgi:hypothetical protein